MYIFRTVSGDWLNHSLCTHHSSRPSARFLLFLPLARSLLAVAPPDSYRSCPRHNIPRSSPWRNPYLFFAWFNLSCTLLPWKYPSCWLHARQNLSHSLRPRHNPFGSWCPHHNPNSSSLPWHKTYCSSPLTISLSQVGFCVDVLLIFCWVFSGSNSAFFMSTAGWGDGDFLYDLVLQDSAWFLCWLFSACYFVIVRD